MKKIFYVVFVVLMVLSFSALAQAQVNTKGIYIGLIGGYVMPNDLKGSLNDIIIEGGYIEPIVSTDFDTSLKDGYLAGAKVGYLIPFSNRALALEFEYNHIENEMDSLIKAFGYGVDVDVDGKVKIDLFMFNLIFRYPAGRFHPFIGSGIGCAYAQISDSSINDGVSYFIGGGGSDTVFAYQFMAGLDFDITKNIVVGMSYKYLALDTMSYNSNFFGSVDQKLERDYNAHNIMLSLSYMF